MDLLTFYAAVITLFCAIGFLKMLADDEGNSALGMLMGWLILGLPFFGRAFGWW